MLFGPINLLSLFLVQPSAALIKSILFTDAFHVFSSRRTTSLSTPAACNSMASLLQYHGQQPCCLFPPNRGRTTRPSVWITRSASSSSNDRTTTIRLRKTQLKADLKEYRILQSRALKKPAYFVFTNAALEEIYTALPTTRDELLQFKGIGPKTLELYGEDILSLVSPYTRTITDDTDAAAFNPNEALLKPKTPLSTPKRKVGIDRKELTAEQRSAADAPLSPSRPNVFITGSAGTGKSYLLKYLVQEFTRQRRGSKNKVGVCAPTGVAAVHIGGSTLHSFFGVGLGTGSVSSLVKKVQQNLEAKQRIDETDVLIVDECSMLSSDLLETLDAVTRQVRLEGRYSDKPFGGMQLVCFGDFFQLPPVVSSSRSDDDGYNNNFEKPFCFESPVWSQLGLTDNMIELKQVLRQDNPHFVSLLNKIRNGTVSQRDIEQLNSQCLIREDVHPLPTDGILPTRLYSHNRDVDSENESRLAELEGPEVECYAHDSWRERMPIGTSVKVKKRLAESLSKEMPDVVNLKVGAQVMLTRNKDLDRNLVNGSRGVVIRLDQSPKDETMVIPVVRFDCGVVLPVAPVETVRYNPSGETGCLVRKQVPLKLAWALTVHKSQGATLTRAMLDISSAFEYGQCYVALSRVQSLEGLWLIKPAGLRNIKVSPQVLGFYNKI